MLHGANKSLFHLVFHVVSDDDADKQCESNHAANEDKQMNEDALRLHSTSTVTSWYRNNKYRSKFIKHIT